MTTKVNMEEGHFLNDAQKKIKQSIMENLLESIFLPISENASVLDSQSITDIILSCLLMFNREVLCHFFMNSNAMPSRLKIMRRFFKDVEKQVQIKINSLIKEKTDSMN